MNKLGRFLVYLALSLTPVIYHKVKVINFYLYVEDIALMAALGVLILRVIATMRIPKTGAPGLLLGWVFLTLLFLIDLLDSTSLSLSLRNYLLFVKPGLGFLVGFAFFHSKHEIHRGIKVMVFFATLGAVMGVVEHFAGVTWNASPKDTLRFGISRVEGALGGPNTFANYMVQVLPFTLLMVLVSPGKMNRVLSSVSALCIMLAVGLTYSRGGWLALLVALLVFIQRTKGIKTAVIVTIVVVGTAISFQPNILPRMLDAFANGGSGRLQIYSQELQEISKSPFVGVGFDHYVATAKEGLRGAHNIVIQIIVETGVLGLFVAFWIVFGQIVLVWRKMRLKQQPYLASAFISSQLAFMVHGMFESVLFSTRVNWLFGVLLGWTCNLSRDTCHEYESNPQQ